MDEKGFMMGRTGKQRRIVPLAQAREQGGTSARMDGSRLWVSLLACICADGSALTPAVIFPGKQVGEGWMDELSDEEKYWVTASEKGWTSEEIGLRWLEEVFHPETQAKAGQRRRLLIMDGHSSHVNSAFIQQCDSFRINLLILPPHSTHRLQPLDVGLFSPLATAYTTIFDRQWQAHEGRLYVNKARFFGILMQAWHRAVTSDNIQGSFAKAGIYPHDRSLVINKVFRPTAQPRTPSPVPTDIAMPPSSPLNEGGSQELVRKVRSNKKKAPYAVVKMDKRIKALEARVKLAEAANAGLREGLSQAGKRKAFKPIVPGHEARHGVWIGPEDVEAHKRQQDEEKAAEEERERVKMAKKQQQADNKAAREAEKARKAAERAEKDAYKANFLAARQVRDGGLAARALQYLDTNQAGPSNPVQY